MKYYVCSADSCTMRKAMFSAFIRCFDRQNRIADSRRILHSNCLFFDVIDNSFSKWFVFTVSHSEGSMSQSEEGSSRRSLFDRPKYIASFIKVEEEVRLFQVIEGMRIASSEL